MIQRKQTIFLFLGVLFLVSLFLQSFDWIRIETENSENLQATTYLQDTVIDVYDHVLFSSGIGLLVVLLLLTIFLYKKRKLQLLISQLSLLLLFLIIIAIALFFLKDTNNIYAPFQIKPDWGIAPLILTIIVIILARNGIKKDDRLVKSMDRLR